MNAALRRRCRSDGAGDFFGVGFYKDFAPTELGMECALVGEFTRFGMRWKGGISPGNPAPFSFQAASFQITLAQA